MIRKKNDTTERTQCALCELHLPLRDSHIIPSFVFKWLKATSATGYLRNTLGNQRIQDGPKIKLLCQSCEGILNGFETPFAKEIFLPYVETILSPAGTGRGNHILRYEKWLLKLAISLQWRSLHLRRAKEYDSPSKWKHLIDETETVWRKYLLGTSNDPGPWEHHLFFLHNVEDVGIPDHFLPEGINSYLLRSVDMEYPTTDVNIYQISKIGPILFWSYLQPVAPPNQLLSKIQDSGEIHLPQMLINEFPMEYIIRFRLKQLAPLLQSNKIVMDRVKKSFIKNPNRAMNSLSKEVWNSDQRIAKKNKPNKPT